jgi:hypothetical protein
VGLVLSYAVGLFGWVVTGLRAPVAIAIAAVAGAILVLAGALGVEAAADS